MARDNSPRNRQAQKLARKQGNRLPADRILIVSEGSKTEPQYFEEIRQVLKLPTANICMMPSDFGTSPDQVVEYAMEIFQKGCPHRNIRAKSFEKVYAVFDRDEHAHYFDALKLVKTYQQKKLKNDLKEPITVKAFASIPSFELWLLLHFEDCFAPIHRHDVVKKLKHKNYIKDYEKAQQGLYLKTKAYLPEATERATSLTEKNTAEDGVQPYTNIHELVTELHNIKPTSASAKG
ncbi:MAG: RloB domain-containing protein [Methylococcales bacterium]|jgi:hypothetical protein|nr:RloB domain-containing protein [Methylococcales bacterium]MBT7442991.1 RloB domain-containing protein [Methylococcales bacterium]